MDVVAQSRVWNWVIDVVAWSGHYNPNATNFQRRPPAAADKLE
jgi:hypothetical protein